MLIRNDIDQVTLPTELWQLIFQNLEPIFLNSVLRTSKSFNILAIDNSVFTPLLNKYYIKSLEKDEQQHNPERSSSYTVFKELFSQETHKLSSAAIKLLDLCKFNDLDQIRLFEFEPDILFEKDAYETLVLSHVNRTNNQTIRNILFQKIHNWFIAQAKVKEWWDALPLSLLIDGYSDRRAFEFSTKQCLMLMGFAVALNQLNFIKDNITYFVTHYRNNNENLTHLQSACLFGHLDILQYILARNGFDDNFHQAPEEYALCRAVTGSQYEIIEFLITTHRGFITQHMLIRAIECAANDNRIDILELLLLQLDDSSPLFYNANRTLLDTCCEDAQPKAAKLITAMFPDLATEDTDLDRYLLASIKSGCNELIEFFMSDITDINEYLDANPNMLTSAATSGHVDTVNYLLELGAPIDAIDETGNTPLHAATLENHLNVIRLLVQKGADMTINDAHNKTALDIAKFHTHNTDISIFLMNEQFNRSKKRKVESAPEVEGVELPPTAAARR